MISFILLFLGLALILIEFYIPGAVMGILGGISILCGILLFASQSSSLTATLLFVIGSAAAVALVVRFALWRIVNTKSNGLYSVGDQEGYQASSYDHSAIGKKGTVLADLKPGGFILIEGRQHSAISVSGYLSKGEEVTVISGQEQSLIVKGASDMNTQRKI